MFLLDSAHLKPALATALSIATFPTKHETAQDHSVSFEIHDGIRVSWRVFHAWVPQSDIDVILRHIWNHINSDLQP